MLQILENLPPHVAGFRATGEVTKSDYESVLVPEVDRIDKEHGHIHLLMILNTPVKNFTLGAWLEDAMQGLKHYRGWKKVAIATDEKGIEKFSTMFSAVIPGKARGFTLAEIDEAKRWVAEE